MYGEVAASQQDRPIPSVSRREVAMELFFHEGIYVVFLFRDYQLTARKTKHHFSIQYNSSLLIIVCKVMKILLQA